MPDIAMCPDPVCPMRCNCYRSADSGTKPSEYMQTFFRDSPRAGAECVYFWPIEQPTSIPEANR